MRRFSMFVTAAAMLLSTTALAHAQERGGVMTFGRYADSLFLDPVLNDATVDIWTLTNMYDTLLLPTADGQSVQPGLATDWSMSDDGLTVTLTMRDGIKFSDGKPITTEDVIWSLDRARDPNNGIWNFLLGSIENVSAPDAKTIQIKLSKPDPTILPALSVFNAAIMPKAAFEAMPGTTDLEKATAFAKKPVGSGPFVLESWDRGSTLKLVKNQYYWADGKDGQKLPYLDGVTFEVIPDDATRILRVQSGELDGAEQIPFARVKELEGSAGINMQLFPSTRIADIIMNVRAEVNGQPNPLSDAKVRQAMNYAANKDAIIQVVTYGMGVPTSSFMSTTTPLHTGEGAVFPYDLDKAKQLMAESGFPGGFTISMLTLAGDQNELGTATALQQMWSQIGIKLDIQQVDNATRTEQYRNGTFEMRAGAWTNDIADPNQITSYFAYSPTINALHSGWKSEEVDKLFEASQSELDTAKRAEQYARIQEVFNHDGPTVLLYETPYPVALQDNVKGFNQIPLGNYVLRETYLEKK